MKKLTQAWPYDPSGQQIELQPNETLWQNGTYVVIRREYRVDEAHLIHLSIRRQDNKARPDWRDYQDIKNQLAGPHWEGMELYPDIERVVDVANQSHIWCVPIRLPFGFKEKLQVDAVASNEQWGATQRPLGDGEVSVEHQEELQRRRDDGFDPLGFTDDAIDKERAGFK